VLSLEMFETDVQVGISGSTIACTWVVDWRAAAKHGMAWHGRSFTRPLTSRLAGPSVQQHCTSDCVVARPRYPVQMHLECTRSRE
jgi:hypothetical protein